MKLKLTLESSGRSAGDDDLLVSADPSVTVGALAEVLARRNAGGGRGATATPLTIRYVGERGPWVVPPAVALADAGIRSGDAVSVVDGSGRGPERMGASARAATLHVVEGPDAGRSVPLAHGLSRVGRGPGNHARLTDPAVSKRHALLKVTDVVEVVDLGSTNGVVVDGERVNKVVLRRQDSVLLGDSLVSVEHHGAAPAVFQSGAVTFNRAPYLDRAWPGQEVVAPEAPEPPQRRRFPFISLLVPLLMVLVFLRMGRGVSTMVYFAFAPLIVVGGYLDFRRSGRRAYDAACADFHAALADFEGRLTSLAKVEGEHRRREHPATSEACDAARERFRLLWCRRPDRHGFLELRLGLGRLPSRTAVRMPSRRTTPELWQELTAVAEGFEDVDRVPVVAALRDAGAAGVAGPRSDALDVARGLVAQLVALHSPAEVVVGAVASSASAPDWDWLKWLPHTGSEHSPLDVAHLAASPAAAVALIAAIEELIEQRSSRRHLGGGAGPGSLPVVVLVVEDDAEADRNRLVDLTERGPAAGIHVVWVAPSVERLPAACAAFVDLDRRTGDAAAGFVVDGSMLAIEAERLDARAALDLARTLAPLVDAGARADEESDLPASVSFLAHIGHEVAACPDAIVDRWSQSGPRVGPTGSVAARRRPCDLAAYVGQGTAGPVVLDLRAHGPHALVGGTTGAGKSEFLQTWVASMAVNHGPDRVTFLFVDYKGGAAFSECVALPHCVGLVTDLTPHLVGRALRSLDAELRRREELLHRKRAKDLLELEENGDPDTPPSLVIVVDEFAALIAEVPRFVDGILNVAQRGRSLGLHLILATQRPAGVIRDNLRANTSLRIALRVADHADSVDVVGTDVAASFDPGTPGRCVAKVGPGRVQTFQAAYVGGWTDAEAPPPALGVERLRFGPPAPWGASQPSPPTAGGRDPGPNDLHRVVGTVRAAAATAGMASPLRPWLPELAETYDLAGTTLGQTDDELVFAIADLPDQQAQAPVAFRPDREGNMVVLGTGGSGKSAFLRTLAIVAGLSGPRATCHVYGLDFAGQGLAALEGLPHVGSIVSADDDERVVRLLGFVRDLVDERSRRYAAAQAATVTEYRVRSGRDDEPRILLLVDGFPAFRAAYESSRRSRWYDVFQSIAADGRPVGVHVVMAADRLGALPSALASLVQRRLVLRLASDAEYPLLGAPADGFAATTPPGRGFIDGTEVQVLVPGGSSGMADQAAAAGRLGKSMRAGPHSVEAPAIQRLTARVRLGELPLDVGGLPPLGIADDTFAPCGFATDGVLVVTGPPQSGRTSVVAAIALAVRRARPDTQLVLLGRRRSPLLSLVSWTESATDLEAVAEAAKRLAEMAVAHPDDTLPAVVVEDPASFVSTVADAALQSMVKAYRAAGGLVVAESETSAMASSMPLLQLLKSGRHGVALTPDQVDGETVFRTPFPRTSRADYPPGRGLYVRLGRTACVQCALPDLGDQ